MTTTTMNHTVDESIVARIKKLLALAEHENSNVGEAGNAAAKVQELLDAHNLEMAQILAYDLDTGGGIDITEIRHTYGPLYSALNKAWQALMAMVAGQHNCTILLTRGWENKTEKELRRKKDNGYPKKEVAKFCVIGERTNAEAVTHIFDWLRGQLEIEATKAWPIYKAQMDELGRYPGDPIPFRVNFIFGATAEIRNIMESKREQRENFSAVTALAVKYDELNQNFIDEKYEKLGKARGESQSQANGYAYRAGREAGGRVERSREGSLDRGARSALPA